MRLNDGVLTEGLGLIYFRLAFGFLNFQANFILKMKRFLNL